MVRRTVALLTLGIAGCHLLVPHAPSGPAERSAPDLAPRELGRMDAAGDAGQERRAFDARADLPPALVDQGGPCPGGPTSLVTNLPARQVLGQQDFTSTAANRNGQASAGTLQRPIGIGVLGNRLYVSDSKNHRVLVYHSSGSNGAAAIEVFGQPDFAAINPGTTATSLNIPQGLHVDGDGLMVAEWQNHRISFWPTAGNAVASNAWGQPTLTDGIANNGGPGPKSLQNPSFVARYGTKVLITDATNNRVPVYDRTAPPAPFQPAVLVLGQPDFTSITSGSASNRLHFPLGVASDGVRLVIVDGYNYRLVIFDTFPTQSGAAPSRVWGKGGTSATTLENPVGALVIGQRLLVTDRGNNRILVFNSWPMTETQPADLVIGQPSMTTGQMNQCNCSKAGPNTLYGPHFMAWDGCRLYVTDSENHRVLIY